MRSDFLGCDIHIKTEVLNCMNEWVDGDVYNYKEEIVPILYDRNYELFAILANVRNYENCKYISEPKGLPDDATASTLESYEFWSHCLHSTSFLTLQELIDFDIKQFKTCSVLSELITKLKYRASDFYIRDYNNIRIVFWFDN